MMTAENPEKPATQIVLPAECGDGLLNTTAGETCDDAGESEL